MRTNILAIFIIVFITNICNSQTTNNTNSLSTYVSFLEKQNTSAKDYVLDLFKKYDLVILCERNHQDLVQYELITDIIRDERFVKTVGNVYFEAGTSSLNPRLNEFLHKPDLTDDEVKKEVMFFQRNATPYILWEKYNFTYFLTTLYAINKNLPTNKVNVYPVDIPFDWETASEEKLQAVYNQLGNRDSIMASQIIAIFNFKAANAQKSKGLVIMNYRHAFNRHSVYSKNVGKYLFDKYPDRVANVFINHLKIEKYNSGPIQDGKWDAAFKKTLKDNIGFNFAGSPFGNDSVDIGRFDSKIIYSDFFNGFVYYRPYNEWKFVMGVNGIIGDDFSQEFVKRVEMFNLVFKKNISTNIDTLKMEYNSQTEEHITNKKMQSTIDKWLE